MAQVINTNSLSLITQNNINKNQSSMSTAIERLSSGLRINSAKDDAAGQAIANRFTSNIKVKWHTEFGHLNRGDMLTSEQHRCSNEKKKFQRRV